MIAGSGRILSLIVSDQGASRASLARSSGLSRSTIGDRLSTLFNAGLVHETDETMPSGGRPARVLRLNPDFGLVLAADIGESQIRTALTDLAPRILAEAVDELRIKSGPAPILNSLATGFRSLLARAERSEREVLGIGIALPAPVDYNSARVADPSTMRGWDDFDIRAWFGKDFHASVFVDNDAKLLALAEHQRFWPDVDDFLFIKVGTTICSGIVTNGRILRGAQGAAGDIGHIQVDGDDQPLCRCGKLGCLEAHAGGWALARDLRADGFQTENARDVLALARSNEPNAIRYIRDAGRLIGKVTSDLVSVLNPNVIVIGGALAGAEEHLLSGIRELVYQRCLPLATRKMAILPCLSDHPAAVVGAAQMAINVQLQPDAIERILTERAAVSANARAAPTTVSGFETAGPS